MNVALKNIEAYFEAKNKVFETFDVDGYLEIDNHVEHEWHLSDDYISYLNDGEVYSFEYAKQVGKTVDGIQMFYVQENGEKYYALFDLNKHLTDEEAEEKLDW